MHVGEHLWPGGLKGYETILWLMLFNTAGSGLSGRLPGWMFVCLLLTSS